MAWPAPGYEFPMATIRSDSGIGSGFSRTLCTTENRAVFAPMHSASVSTAVIENALSFQRSRRPTRISFHIKEVDECGRNEVRCGTVSGAAAALRRALRD